MVAADPVDVAVRVDVREHLLARAVPLARHLGALEREHASVGDVAPPLAAAVEVRHREIEQAVLVEVVREVNLGLRVFAVGHREAAGAVVDAHERAAAVGRHEEIEIAVAVEIDEVQARQPPVGGFRRAQGRDAALLGDRRETAARVRDGGEEEHDERGRSHGVHSRPGSGPDVDSGHPNDVSSCPKICRIDTSRSPNA